MKIDEENPLQPKISFNSCIRAAENEFNKYESQSQGNAFLP
jgi:hypothetical protein